MADYRLLDRGEIIQQGDEPLMDDCQTWGSLVGWEVGMAYSPAVMVPTRRPLTPTDKEGGE